MITTALELLFADGEYLFDLKLPQMAELQEKRGPAFEIYGRVTQGCVIDVSTGTTYADTTKAGAYAEDLFEIIRLGLIGGGRGVVDGKEVDVSPLTAKQLVERYCHTRPLRESWAVARSIMLAKIEGYEPKKEEPARAPAAEKKPTARKKSTSS